LLVVAEAAVHRSARRGVETLQRLDDARRRAVGLLDGWGTVTDDLGVDARGVVVQSPVRVGDGAVRREDVVADAHPHAGVDALGAEAADGDDVIGLAAGQRDGGGTLGGEERLQNGDEGAGETGDAEQPDQGSLARSKRLHPRPPRGVPETGCARAREVGHARSGSYHGARRRCAGAEGETATRFIGNSWFIRTTRSCADSWFGLIIAFRITRGLNPTEANVWGAEAS